MDMALALMTVMWACSLAQPSCPPAIGSLQPCIGFITGNSSTLPPQSWVPVWFRLRPSAYARSLTLQLHSHST